MTDRNLLERAAAAMANSYSPYSRFPNRRLNAYFPLFFGTLGRLFQGDFNSLFIPYLHNRFLYDGATFMRVGQNTCRRNPSYDAEFYGYLPRVFRY